MEVFKKGSSALIFIVVTIIFLSLSSGIFAISLTKSIDDNIENIKDLTILRGTFQRLTKLELAGIESSDLLNDIDNKVEDLEQVKISLASSESSQSDSAMTSIDQVMESWDLLKASIIQYRLKPNDENKEALAFISEDIWTKSDQTVSILLDISLDRVNLLNSAYVFMVFQLLLGFIAILMIIIYVKRNLEFHVAYDFLTNLYNRRYFNKRLNKKITSSKRHSSPFSLVVFDIDHFKNINDQYGHDVGDSVLKELSSLLLKNKRKDDLLARIGGEEFAIIIADTNASEAFKLAEKMRTFIEEHEFKHVGQVTISIGITDYSPGDDSNQILKRADDALYHAKESGRNMCVIETKEI